MSVLAFMAEVGRLTRHICRSALARVNAIGQAASVVEHVVQADLGVRWDPNTEHGVVIAQDGGPTRLRLRAHMDDADQRIVELLWNDAVATQMEPPNDEAISGHRLYASGLSEIHWAGEVNDSALIADLERRNRVHDRHNPARYADLRHWVIRLKGCVVEVVARTCEVRRIERTTR